MPKIEVKNVYKIFGANPSQAFKLLEQGMDKRTILKKKKLGVGVNNASFSIDEGEIFVVMGLSGSGKSTLIRCINRLIEPTSGSILIDGEDIMSASRKQLRSIRRKKLAMVFQNFALLPNRTIIENVAFGLEIQKVNIDERKSRAKEMLNTVGLKGYDNSYPRELSGGMQQRVGLARALANDADILLMDEAFSALDPLIRKDMQDQLLVLQKSLKKTIVFITHDLDEALKIGDRIAIMKDGVIVQIGAPEEILHNPADDYVREFTQDVNRSNVVTASSIMRKAEYITLEKSGRRIASRRMRDLGISSLFVCDKAGALLGVVTIDDITQSDKNDESGLSGLIHSDVVTVSPETSISEMIPLVLQSSYPLAVVDSENHLEGIIFKSTILAGMSGEEVQDVY